jgi:hypothetical protein
MTVMAMLSKWQSATRHKLACDSLCSLTDEGVEFA